MAYLVLARKYRPQFFSDVAGQDHVTRTLMNALSQGRIAHGYIFSGHRGIGKTTIARILAMALNCRNAIGSAQRPTAEPCGVCESCTEIRAGNAVDVIEIDAATNRGIDEIRELRDAARYRPARDRYKIYILDEAHQITDAAFNALLKTLEEPPDHVVFMMATTQPEDIPQTIRSRCQHFSFHAVKFDDILEQLRTIAAQENVTATPAALALLAEAGDGSMRDALSIMDQAIASAPVTGDQPHLDAPQILELMGSVPNTVFERLMEAISENQSATVIEEINRLLNAGNSPAQLARQFVRYLRNCLMARLGGESSELLQISPDERARAARSAMLFSEEDLTRFLDVMLRTFDQLNYRQEQRFHLELGLLKLVHLQRLLPVEQFLSQLPVPGKTPGGGGLPGGGPVRTLRSTSPAPPSQAPTASPSSQQPGAKANSLPAVPFSPFGAETDRKMEDQAAKSESSPPPVPAAMSVPRAPTPLEVTSSAVEMPDAVALAGPVSTESEPENRVVQVERTLPTFDLDTLRDAVSNALEAAGHHTAAALLSNGNWLEADGNVRVEVRIKQTMLGLTMNAEAEKIVKTAARETGFTRPISIISAANGDATPANGSPRTAAKRPAAAGSVQSEALAHPLVKQALELFNGEVRSVLDLREKRNG
ncbi:DNA polymerase III subunits gamma and tau [Acidisarcina polymorpha]|uniref:DNA polymerase III subunit gamma/tau n=1 Tax=Acidisarcina polymorpha TaxID=2211140 RepID=A0A2Z5G7C4_9BACT|nr:DNA polymerase III subunit gamma/tau [Acidisarcina polymorpha]AXC14707.1 DNA polymerase III subunits gamma and tau [Acidisarcina polymorpha]